MFLGEYAINVRNNINEIFEIEVLEIGSIRR